MNCVRAGLQRRNVVGHDRGTGKVLALEDLRPAPVVDVDVVRRSGVLVVEDDLEGRVGRRADLVWW